MIVIKHTIKTNILTVEEEPFQLENNVTVVRIDWTDTLYEDWIKYVSIQMADDGTGVISDPLGTGAVVDYPLLDDLLADGYIRIQATAVSGNQIKKFPIKAVRVKPSLHISAYTPSMTDDAFIILQGKVFTLESEMAQAQSELTELPNLMHLDGSNSNIDKLVFDTTPASTDPLLEGQLRWNPLDKTLDIGVDGDGVVLQAGQETHYPRTVNTGTVAINDGDVVMYNGTTGGSGVINIKKYDPAVLSLPGLILGVATENIAISAQGKITWFGLINGVQTNGADVGEVWTDNTVLYNHPTLLGKMSKTKPTAPINAVQVAVVVRAHASNGILFIRPIFFPTLGMLSNVAISNPQDKNVIAYNNALQRWENMLLNATSIPNTPAGNISATTVQGAINELDTEKAPTVHTHDDRYFTETEINTALALKADKTQEAWQTLTLSNGWAGTLKIAKSSNGFVTITFDLVGGTSTYYTQFATAPTGYRPPVSTGGMLRDATNTGTMTIQVYVFIGGEIRILAGSASGRTIQGIISYYAG